MRRGRTVDPIPQNRQPGCRLTAIGGARWLVVIAVATLFIPCVPGGAAAESDRAVSGTISDRISGTPIEGARLAVEGTDWCALSDAAGRFVLRAVPSGTWSITIDRFGFRRRRLDGVEVREGFERMLHVTLDPSPVVLPGQEVTSRRTDQLTFRRAELSPAQRARGESVAEVLAEIPGVRVYGSSETPGGVRVSVGGEPAERVAVLLDGVPLSGGADGAVDLAAISPAAIRAVEVRAGGQSSALGDAAVGGTVNLITTPTAIGAAPWTEAQAIAGTFDSYRAALTQRLPPPLADGSVTVEGFQRGPRFSYPSGDTGATRTGVASDGSRVFARWDGLPHGIAALGFFYAADNGVPGPLEQGTPGATNSDRHGRCQVQWQSPAQRPTRGAAAIWYETTRERYRSPQTYKADAEWHEAYLGGRLDLGIDAPWLAGQVSLETRQRRLEGIDHQHPTQSFGVQRRFEYAVRGNLRRGGALPLGSGDLMVASALDLEVGGRGVLSPRLDLSWSVIGGLTLHGGWGRSFRRPGLTSLFWKSDAYAAGNPDLRPERASEWDVAAGWFRRGIVLETRYFERRVKNIIVWERDFTGKYKPQNLRAASVIGREDHLVIERSHGDRSVSFDYTHVFTSASDESGEPNTDGQTLVFTPRHTHQLGLSGQVGRLSGRVQGRWVSARFTRRANTKSLSPYRIFDGSVELVCRRRAPRLVLAVNAENLTNEYVELLERYPSPGRSWSLVLAMSL